jgi:PAS domain S-box-containing protein
MMESILSKIFHKKSSYPKRGEVTVKSNGGRRKRRLSADDIDELIEMADDEKVRRFWQTIKEEKLRSGSLGATGSRRRKFLSLPLYNNSIAIVFILALLSFSTWFLFKYTSVSIPVDITQPVLVVVFAFSAIMFHRYVSDKEEIVGMLDELAGYSIQNESVFENIGNALIVVDATGKVNKINRKAEDILEVKNHELAGRDCRYISGNQELGELLLQTLRTGSFVANREIELESSKGIRYSLQVTTSLLQNKRGHTIGAVELINDVTEIRELQEKLRLNEHLVSIGELSAKLGHEIGNSLGGIKLFTDNLMEELLPEDHRREYAEEILSEIDHLMASVTKLKDYARPVSLDPKETNVNEVVDEALSFTGGKIQENGILIKKRLGENVPDIMIDREQVRGALLNIIINAIQAMPKGGEITISTRRMNGNLELSVSDTGMGMPEDIRSKIFNPFFTTKKTLGTGLGLSIVYKTVQSHGGTIKCDSEVGRGTTFTIGLPLESRESLITQTTTS